MWLVFVSGQLMFTGLTYIIGDWRYLSYLTNTIPVLGMNFLIQVYYESPRSLPID